MTTTFRRVALVAWIFLAVFTVGGLLTGFIFPVWTGALMLLLAMLAWVVLLVVYNRLLAQWRGILLIWLAFGLLRGAANWLGFGDGVLGGVVASLLAVLYLYALVAGYAAIIALVIRLDVSVAYILIPTALGTLAMLWTVRSVGGVTQWFDALTSPSAAGRSVILESLLLSLSCMGTVGFIAAIPHMIMTGIREVRGN